MGTAEMNINGLQNENVMGYIKYGPRKSIVISNDFL